MEAEEGTWIGGTWIGVEETWIGDVKDLIGQVEVLRESPAEKNTAPRRLEESEERSALRRSLEPVTDASRRGSGSVTISMRKENINAKDATKHIQPMETSERNRSLCLARVIEQVPVGTTMRPGGGLVEEEGEEVIVVVWWAVLMIPMRLEDVLSIDFE